MCADEKIETESGAAAPRTLVGRRFTSGINRRASARLLSVRLLHLRFPESRHRTRSAGRLLHPRDVLAFASHEAQFTSHKSRPQGRNRKARDGRGPRSKAAALKAAVLRLNLRRGKARAANPGRGRLLTGFAGQWDRRLGESGRAATGAQV